MVRKDFGSKWRSHIHRCLVSSHFSILLNGLPCVYFPASSGFRQGDPLSIHHCGRILQLYYSRVVEQELLKGFCIGRDKEKVSYLQYASEICWMQERKSFGILNLPLVVCKVTRRSGLLGLGNGSGDIDTLAEVLQCQTNKWFEVLGLQLGGYRRDKEFQEPHGAIQEQTGVIEVQ